MWCDSCLRPSPLRELLLLGKFVRLTKKKKSWARTAFDMHSSHNLVASFSKESHELRLDVWPQLRLFRACVSPWLLIKELKSYIARLITTIPPPLPNSSYALLEPLHPVRSILNRKLEQSAIQPKGGHTQKKNLLPKELPEEAMAAGYLMTARLSSLSLGCKNCGGEH